MFSIPRCEHIPSKSQNWNETNTYVLAPEHCIYIFMAINNCMPNLSIHILFRYVLSVHALVLCRLNWKIACGLKMFELFVGQVVDVVVSALLSGTATYGGVCFDRHCIELAFKFSSLLCVVLLVRMCVCVCDTSKPPVPYKSFQW